MKHLPLFIAALICHCLTSCGGDDPSVSATGFDTPEAALEAYGAALTAGDEAAFRKVAAMNPSAIGGLDAIISLETDTPKDEAARINLVSLADMQGFTGLSKRFPAEISGDKATIVHLFEDWGAFSTDDKFRKWHFEKKGEQWFLTGSEFGDAKALPDHPWDKNIADVSAEMKDFISGFDGTSDAVEAALAKHSAEGEIETANMDLFNLEQPAVVKKEEKDGQTCYTLQTISGSVRNTYRVFWKDQKITAVESVE